MPTALDNGQRSPRKLLATVVRRLLASIRPRRGWRYRAGKVGPDTSAGANQTVQLPTPHRVARHAGNAPHRPEHAHELTERLRVGENVRVGIV
jgi:hypothetical protein